MKYPIGIQIFSQIRENRSVFTDKTDFIYQLVIHYFIHRYKPKSKKVGIVHALMLSLYM